MRFRLVTLSISVLLLTACEQEFDDKYEDNLQALEEEAKAIQSDVDQQLAEGEEADRALAGEEPSAPSESNGTEP